MNSVYRFLVGVVATAVLASCSALPADGPSAQRVGAGAQSASTDGYEVIDIDGTVIDALGRLPSRSLVGTFGRESAPPGQRIGIGDVVAVSIWEAAPGGLFSPAGGVGPHAEAMPPQTVDRDGRISLPYVGRIQAAGRAPADLAKAIEKAIGDRGIEPQAVVSLLQTPSSSVTVAGEVTGGGRIALNIKGDRLLEVIAQAGGVRAAAHETMVRVTRGHSSVEVPLTTILKKADENIYVQPGDVVYVTRQPQSFTALGAVTKPGEQPIDREDFHLSQALGVMGGLNNAVADATGVFLFREEDPRVLAALRPNSPLLAEHRPLRVIYRLNFTTADAYFYAGKMPVQRGDIVYVSSAPSVDLMKFLTLLRLGAQTARSIQAVDPNY